MPVIDLKVADRLGLEPAGFGLRGWNDCLEPKPNLSERKTHLRACSYSQSGDGAGVEVLLGRT
jgi:hypothetical protein